MSEVVTITGHSYEKLTEKMLNSTKWLVDNLGFDDLMIKMVPGVERWEHWLAGDDKHYAAECGRFKNAHPWLKQVIWQCHVDEMEQETGIKHDRDEQLVYILRQSGPGWVRWYSIFGGQEPDCTYYISTVFDDPMQAFTYRLCV